jgi:hypothetical protein
VSGFGYLLFKGAGGPDYELIALNPLLKSPAPDARRISPDNLTLFPQRRDMRTGSLQAAGTGIISPRKGRRRGEKGKISFEGIIRMA